MKEISYKIWRTLVIRSKSKYKYQRAVTLFLSILQKNILVVVNISSYGFIIPFLLEKIKESISERWEHLWDMNNLINRCISFKDTSANVMSSLYIEWSSTASTSKVHIHSTGTQKGIMKSEERWPLMEWMLQSFVIDGQVIWFESYQGLRDTHGHNKIRLSFLILGWLTGHLTLYQFQRFFSNDRVEKIGLGRALKVKVKLYLCFN
jgi:hypothetical protein